ARWGDFRSAWAEAWRAGEVPRLAQERLLPLFVHRLQIRRELGRLWADGWRAWSDDYRLARTAEAAAAPPAPPAPASRLPADVGRYAGPAPVPAAPAPGPDEAAAKYLRRLHDWLDDYRVGGGSAAALRHLVAACRAHGLAVLLVAPPVTARYRAEYSPA